MEQLELNSPIKIQKLLFVKHTLFVKHFFLQLSVTCMLKSTNVTTTKKNKLTNMSVSVRSQGVDTTETRQVSTKVPLAQVPYIMRALGFYPTEQEV